MILGSPHPLDWFVVLTCLVAAVWIGRRLQGGLGELQQKGAGQADGLDVGG